MFGLLFSFEGETSSDLVMKAKWTHLYSSRTQKLSTSAATIAGRAPVKIARCQVGRPVLRRTGFFYIEIERQTHSLWTGFIANRVISNSYLVVT